jgi:hypothetical protein
VINKCHTFTFRVTRNLGELISVNKSIRSLSVTRNLGVGLLIVVNKCHTFTFRVTRNLGVLISVNKSHKITFRATRNLGVLIMVHTTT